MAIRKGQRAPDFSLYTDDKQEFVLSNETADRPVVLLFFPGAFTSTCTAELNAVSNDLASFGAETCVVGISTDSPFVLAEYRRVNGFGFNLLSDHDAKVSALYGAKYDHDFTPMRLDRISRRAAFVIDRDGIVAYAEVLENAGRLPDMETVREIAAGLS